MWCLLLAKVFTAIIATLLVVDQASKSVGLNLYDTLTLSMNTPTSSVVVIPNDNARVNFAASEPVILANDTQHVFVELKPTDPLQKSRSDKQWEFLKLKTREMLIVLSSAVARLVSVIEFYIGFVTERLPGYPFNVQNLEEFRRFLHQKVDNDQQRIYLSPKSFRSLITMIAFQLRQSLIRIITNLLTIVKAVLGLTFHFSSFVVLLVTCARYCHSVISKHEDYVTDLEASYKELVSQLKSSHRRSVAILRVSYAGYMTSLESRYKEMLVELHSSHEKDTATQHQKLEETKQELDREKTDCNRLGVELRSAHTEIDTQKELAEDLRSKHQQEVATLNGKLSVARSEKADFKRKFDNAHEREMRQYRPELVAEREKEIAKVRREEQIYMQAKADDRIKALTARLRESSEKELRELKQQQVALEQELKQSKEEVTIARAQAADLQASLQTVLHDFADLKAKAEASRGNVAMTTYLMQKRALTQSQVLAVKLRYQQVMIELKGRPKQGKEGLRGVSGDDGDDNDGDDNDGDDNDGDDNDGDDGDEDDSGDDDDPGNHPKEVTAERADAKEIEDLSTTLGERDKEIARLEKKVEESLSRKERKGPEKEKRTCGVLRFNYPSMFEFSHEIYAPQTRVRTTPNPKLTKIQRRERKKAARKQWKAANKAKSRLGNQQNNASTTEATDAVSTGPAETSRPCSSSSSSNAASRNVPVHGGTVQGGGLAASSFAPNPSAPSFAPLSSNPRMSQPINPPLRDGDPRPRGAFRRPIPSPSNPTGYVNHQQPTQQQYGPLQSYRRGNDGAIGYAPGTPQNPRANYIGPIIPQMGQTPAGYHPAYPAQNRNAPGYPQNGQYGQLNRNAPGYPHNGQYGQSNGNAHGYPQNGQYGQLNRNAPGYPHNGQYGQSNGNAHGYPQNGHYGQSNGGGNHGRR